jgi:hypothetical protein
LPPKTLQARACRGFCWYDGDRASRGTDCAIRSARRSADRRAAFGRSGVDLVTQPGDRPVKWVTEYTGDTPIPAASENFMSAIAFRVATARRFAALVVLAALAALAMVAATAFHASGSSTASPRWNTATHVVAGKAVFAKPQSPRWN